MAENKQEWIDANKLEIDFTNTMVVFHDRCTKKLNNGQQPVTKVTGL